MVMDDPREKFLEVLNPYYRDYNLELENLFVDQLKTSGLFFRSVNKSIFFKKNKDNYVFNSFVIFNSRNILKPKEDDIIEIMFLGNRNDLLKKINFQFSKSFKEITFNNSQIETNKIDIFIKINKKKKKLSPSESCKKASELTLPTHNEIGFYYEMTPFKRFNSFSQKLMFFNKTITYKDAQTAPTLISKIKDLNLPILEKEKFMLQLLSHEIRSIPDSSFWLSKQRHLINKKIFLQKVRHIKSVFYASIDNKRPLEAVIIKTGSHFNVRILSIPVKQGVCLSLSDIKSVKSKITLLALSLLDKLLVKKIFYFKNMYSYFKGKRNEKI